MFTVYVGLYTALQYSLYFDACGKQKLVKNVTWTDNGDDSDMTMIRLDPLKCSGVRQLGYIQKYSTPSV